MTTLLLQIGTFAFRKIFKKASPDIVDIISSVLADGIRQIEDKVKSSESKWDDRLYNFMLLVLSEAIKGNRK